MKHEHQISFWRALVNDFRLWRRDRGEQKQSEHEANEMKNMEERLSQYGIDGFFDNPAYFYDRPTYANGMEIARRVLRDCEQGNGRRLQNHN